jgi:hypothetical protein
MGEIDFTDEDLEHFTDEDLGSMVPINNALPRWNRFSVLYPCATLALCISNSIRDFAVLAPPISEKLAPLRLTTSSIRSRKF